VIRWRWAVALRGTVAVVLALLLLVGCGGGSGGSTTTPPPPPKPDFTVSASPSTLNVARGSSGDIQVSVAAQNGFTGAVAVTPKDLPTGVTSTAINVNAGGSGTLTLAVAAATGAGPFTITLSATSATLTHSATVMLTVLLGGGVIDFVPQTSGAIGVAPDFAFPPDAAAYLTQLFADATAPGYFYDLCGTAAGSFTGTQAIKFYYDPTGNFTEGPNNQFPPRLGSSSLPKPDADGVDSDFDLRMLHGMAHMLRFQLWNSFGGFFRQSFGDEEGFAQGCADLVARQLADTGKRAEKNGSWGSLIKVDTILRNDALTIEAPGLDPNSYGQPVRYLGEAAYQLLTIASGNSLAPYENAYVAAVNAKGGQLNASDLQQVHSSLKTTIDGISSGTWFANTGVMLSTPASKTGVYVMAFLAQPQLPAVVVVMAFRITQDASGNFTSTPIASAPLTLFFKNTTGADALAPLNLDISQTSSFSNPYFLNLSSILTPAAYTMIAEVTVDGVVYRKRFPFAVVPSKYFGPATNDSPLNYPGTYVIMTDAAGNAVAGIFSVPAGETIVWQAPGIAIIDSPGDVAVNGKIFTTAKPRSRVVTISGP